MTFEGLFVRRGIFTLCLALTLGAAAAEPNLVQNSSFEQWTNGMPDGWVLEGDEGVTQQLAADGGITLGQSAKLTCTAFDRKTRYSAATISQHGWDELKQGEWYLFSCWARQEAMEPAMATVELFADETAVIPYSTQVLFHQLPLYNEWRYYERYFQATTAGTEHGRLTIYFDSTGTMWLDDVTITHVDAPDPTVTDRIPEIGAANLVPNSSFESGTANWSSLGKNVSFVAGLTTLFGELDPGLAYDGDYALRISLNPETTPLATFNWENAHAIQDSPLASNIDWIPVAQGKPYTLSAYMRADRDGVPARLQVAFRSTFGNAGRPGEDVTVSTEWKRYTFTVNAPAPYAFVSVGPNLAGSNLDTATVWIDAIQFEAGSEASDYIPREPVEVMASPASHDHIYDASQPVTVTLAGRNATAVPTTVDLAMRVTDYFDAVVHEEVVPVALGPGATVHHQLTLPINAPGFFRVYVAWQSGGRAHEQDFPIGVIQTYAHDDSPFGVNHAPSTDDLCNVLQRAGVRWVREWSLNWDAIEPEPGKFTFEDADRHINRVLATGMRMAQQLPPFSSTSWNTEAPEGAAEIAPDLPWDLGFYAPKDTESLKRYIHETVNHYKDRFNVWEYLNEPLYTIHSLPHVDQMDANIPSLPGADYTVQNYIDLLAVFDESVKAASPDAITIGGLGGRPDLLTKDYFDAKGLAHSDYFNLHIYPGKRAPEGYVPQMKKLLADMAASETGAKTIWMTEYSYFGVDEFPVDPFVINPVPWAPNRLLDDEKQCADYSIRYAAIMFAHSVEKIFYHGGHSMSCELNEPWAETESALTHYGGIPRKLYVAQAAMANILGPEFTFAGVLPGTETNGVYAYAFQAAGRAVLIAWAPDMVNANRTWTLNAPDAAQVVNVAGTPHGSGPVTLSDSPVYIVDESRSAEALLQAISLSKS